MTEFHIYIYVKLVKHFVNISVSKQVWLLIDRNKAISLVDIDNQNIEKSGIRTIWWTECHPTSPKQRAHGYEQQEDPNYDNNDLLHL